MTTIRQPHPTNAVVEEAAAVAQRAVHEFFLEQGLFTRTMTEHVMVSVVAKFVTSDKPHIASLGVEL